MSRDFAFIVEKFCIDNGYLLTGISFIKIEDARCYKEDLLRYAKDDRTKELLIAKL